MMKFAFLTRSTRRILRESGVVQPDEESAELWITSGSLLFTCVYFVTAVATASFITAGYLVGIRGKN